MDPPGKSDLLAGQECTETYTAGRMFAWIVVVKAGPWKK